MRSELFLTRAQVREVDRRAIEELGIPGVVLMENAGRNAAEEARRLLVDASNLRSAVILCGGGNNGGDGYVIARHLQNWGLSVSLYATVPLEKLSGDAAINAGIWQKMKGHQRSIETQVQLDAASPTWSRTGLLIDALLGTGFSGELRPHMAAVIAAANRASSDAGVPILSVDLPSGLDCDTGTPASPTIRADTTATFVAQKIGFRAPQAKDYLGHVVVCDIGVPHSLVSSIAAQ